MMYIFLILFISAIVVFCMSLCKAAGKEDEFFSELSSSDLGSSDLSSNDDKK